MKKKTIFISIIISLLICSNAFAADGGFADNILDTYRSAVKAWSGKFNTYASYLFVFLGVCSLTWTFGFMAMKRADFGEIFAELIRFIVTFGFFFFLLKNSIDGIAFVPKIIDSFSQMAANAGGLSDSSLSPTDIMNIGFDLFNNTKPGFWDGPIDSIVLFIFTFFVMIITCLIAVEILLLLVSAWILAYGGIIFLGFGGSQWTSSIAINYYKSILSLSVQLFATLLLIGIGKNFLTTFSANIMSGDVTYSEYAITCVAIFIIYMLIKKIPPLFASVISGMGIGQHGLSAGGMAQSAQQMGGGALRTAAGVAGGMVAVKAAAGLAQTQLSGNEGGGGQGQSAEQGGERSPRGSQTVSSTEKSAFSEISGTTGDDESGGSSDGEADSSSEGSSSDGGGDNNSEGSSSGGGGSNKSEGSSDGGSKSNSEGSSGTSGGSGDYPSQSSGGGSGDYPSQSFGGESQQNSEKKGNGSTVKDATNPQKSGGGGNPSFSRVAGKTVSNLAKGMIGAATQNTAGGRVAAHIRGMAADHQAAIKERSNEQRQDDTLGSFMQALDDPPSIKSSSNGINTISSPDSLNDGRSDQMSEQLRDPNAAGLTPEQQINPYENNQ